MVSPAPAVWALRTWQRLRSDVLPFIAYVYFTRFSWMFWLILIALTGFDLAGTTAAYTHGFFALEHPKQFMGVTFYVALASWVSMVSVRIICAYGPERYSSPRPNSLCSDQMTGWALLYSQLPGLFLVVYTYCVSIQNARYLESRLPHFLVWSLVCGIYGYIVAAAVAYMASYFYLLLRTPGPPPVDLTLPYTWPWLKEASTRDLRPSPVVESISQWIAKAIGFLGPGYCKEQSKKKYLHTGHWLALFILFVMGDIYLLAGYATVPVAHGRHAVLSEFMRGFLIVWDLVSWLPVLAVAVFFIYLTIKNRLGRTFAAMSVVAILIAELYRTLSIGQDNWPVIVLVLSLVLFLTFFLQGAAFLLDRYRIPVLTCAIFVSTVATALESHIQESVFEPQSTTKVEPANPFQIAANTALRHPKDPIIIVTASGGGIHSAAWTSLVLEQLQHAFADEGVDFAGHVALISSVSGGSVAAGYWAQSYASGLLQPGPQPCDDVTKSIYDAAQKSTLEAITWGLAYPDFSANLKSLFPQLRSIDRGWALEAALLQNYKQNPCFQSAGNETLGSLAEKALPPAKGSLSSSPYVPAFAFNATESETGERFVLANYRVQRFKSTADEPLIAAGGNQYTPSLQPFEPPQTQPAASYLYSLQHDRYRDSLANPEIPHPVPDIGWPTAARLSATFPWVSPISILKAPFGKWQNYGNHLADGGYYDNDGLATAMEFLWSAYGDAARVDQCRHSADPNCLDSVVIPPAPPDHLKRTGPLKQRKRPVHLRSKAKHVENRQVAEVPKVLLIEIRNSPWQEFKLSPGNTPADPVAQTIAPLLTLVHAWNGGQPSRNQRELMLLQVALAGKVDLHHVVFTFHGPNDKSQTLSWHLTPQDKQQIKDQWDQKEKKEKKLTTPCDIAHSLAINFKNHTFPETPSLFPQQ
jgi:hypothetical protein